MNIVDFLLARISEDEALAAAANVDRWGKPYEAKSWMGFASDVLNSTRDTHEDQDEYIYRFEPARVLAECQAKRAIIGEYQREQWIMEQGHRSEWTESGQAARETTLRHLAAVYADHEDYRQEWKP